MKFAIAIRRRIYFVNGAASIFTLRKEVIGYDSVYMSVVTDAPSLSHDRCKLTTQS